MTTSFSKKLDPGPLNDVGTLWTMRRRSRQARCALIAWPGHWELRVVVDGDILLTQLCSRGAETLRLAELWRNRMLDEGWVQVRRDL